MRRVGASNWMREIEAQGLKRREYILASARAVLRRLDTYFNCVAGFANHFDFSVSYCIPFFRVPFSALGMCRGIGRFARGGVDSARGAFVGGGS